MITTEFINFWRLLNAGLAARGREEANAGQADYCYVRGWSANEAAAIIGPHQEASDEAIYAFGLRLSDDFAKAETARRQREADAENDRLRKEFEEKKRISDAEAQRDANLRAAGVRLPEAAPPIEPLLSLTPPRYIPTLPWVSLADVWAEKKRLAETALTDASS